METHLQVIALADAAVRVHQELRHDEQRDALDAGRRAVDARQHQMDDVLGQVVLAVGDEDLLAVNPVMIALRLGAACAPAPGPNRPAVP